MPSQQGVLFDADYETIGDRSVIRLYVREAGAKGKKKVYYDKSFYPYFYIVPKKGKEKELAESLKEREWITKEGTVFKLKDLNIEEKVLDTEKRKLLKLAFNSTKELITVRHEIKHFDNVMERREYDIAFASRYLVDKQLRVTDWIEYTAKGNEIKNIKALAKEKPVDLLVAAIDIETSTDLKKGIDMKKDSILMASYADNKGVEKVFSYHKDLKKKRYAKVYGSEEEMLKAFKEFLREKNPDVLATYNGDGFDLPYLRERCKTLGLDFGIGWQGEEIRIKRKGMISAAEIKGIQHLDMFQMMKFLNATGAVNIAKFKLENVYEKIFGEKKKDLDDKDKASMPKIFKKGGKKLIEMAEYNLDDSKATLRLAMDYVSLAVELSKLVKAPIYDMSRGSTGVLVEALMFNESFLQDRIIPNKPRDEETKRRIMYTFEGAYVHEPLPGVHENIAVLDFISFHPSIMISYNMSPETMDCGHKECAAKAKKTPTKHYFCTKHKGFVSSVLEKVLKARLKVKGELKGLKKSSSKYTTVFSKQYALKIVLNSFYGYMGYARSRWYSRELVKTVYALVRDYAQKTIKAAQEKGFTVLYGDTDSVFLVIPEKLGVGDVKKLVVETNKSLPGRMELELEGFYKRGIFVTKKEGGGAKKKYALIDEKDRVKIVGFEYVRRDWAEIAKNTQRRILESVLKQGTAEKALKIVKREVKRLAKGKVPLRELVIMTQLTKPVEQYEGLAPHVSAARKAIQRGEPIRAGTLIEYVITKNGKSISDKAQLKQFTREGDYDPEYYTQNQLLPAAMRVLGELGYSAEDLKQGGKQAKLGKWA